MVTFRSSFLIGVQGEKLESETRINVIKMESSHTDI